MVKWEGCTVENGKMSARGDGARVIDLGGRTHFLLLLGWILYFLSYYLTERLIPAERCVSVRCGLDGKIPFCEWFLIPYVLWYGLIAGSLLYFGLREKQLFCRLQQYIFFVQATAVAAYIFFPTRQDLRPPAFPRDNFLTDCVRFLYAVDTNTGVCPSLHVAISLGLASAWLRAKTAPVSLRASVLVLAVLICLSTMFIKQHSAVDALAALPVCLAAEWAVYGRKPRRA